MLLYFLYLLGDIERNRRPGAVIHITDGSGGKWRRAALPLGRGKVNYDRGSDSMSGFAISQRMFSELLLILCCKQQECQYHVHPCAVRKVSMGTQKPVVDGVFEFFVQVRPVAQAWTHRSNNEIKNRNSGPIAVAPQRYVVAALQPIS